MLDRDNSGGIDIKNIADSLKALNVVKSQEEIEGMLQRFNFRRTGSLTLALVGGAVQAAELRQGGLLRAETGRAAECCMRQGVAVAKLAIGVLLRAVRCGGLRYGVLERGDAMRGTRGEREE
eukprot:1180864-Rhodomonas_salina.2